MGFIRSTSAQSRLPGPRYLIVNGDDFGLTEGVTEGIVSAWKDGILTSTTAMINMEGAPERVARAHQANPGLPIGLHMNITQGRPVLPPERIPSLVDGDGCFYPLMKLVERLPQVSFEEVRLECFAQAELMIRSGIPLDHLDYHQGMPAAYAPFFPVVIELARQYSVPVRNPAPEWAYGITYIKSGRIELQAIRAIVGFAALHPQQAVNILPHTTLAAFKRLASKLAAESIPTTNWLIGAFYQNANIESMVSIIEQLPPGISEIGCHPGLVDDDLRRIDYGYVEPRAAELSVLLDGQVKEALRRRQVKLVDFSFLQT